MSHSSEDVVYGAPLWAGHEQTFAATFAFIEAIYLTDRPWPHLQEAVIWRQQALAQDYSSYNALLPALATYAVGGSTEEAVPLTAAWVLSNLASDLFDDLQDQDEKHHPWIQWPPDQVMMTGLGLLFAAQQSLASLDTTHETHRLILERWARTGLLAAQQQAAERPHTTAAYFRQIAAKSGMIYATVTWSGACFAGAPAETVAALEEYGLAIGMLLQLRDDCWDVGVESAGDLQAGRVTLPLLYALSRTDHPRHSQLQTLWDTGARSPEETREIGAILQEMDAFRFVVAMARVYEQKALAALKPLPVERTAPLCTYATHLFETLLNRTSQPQANPER